MAVSVFIAVVIAMALIDAVSFTLVYQHQIKQRVQAVERFSENYLSFTTSLNVNVSGKMLSSEIQKMKILIWDDCDLLTFFLNGEVQSDGESADMIFLRNIFLESLSTGQTQIRSKSHADFLTHIFSKKLFIGVPLKHSNMTGYKQSGVVATFNTSGLIDDLWEMQKIVFVYILLNGIIISTLVFFRLRKVLFDPVEHLVHLAENYQVAEGGGLFPETPDSEFGQLHKAMNSMVQRIENDRKKIFQTVDSLEDSNKKLLKAQDDVVRAEKMAAAGRLSAGLAHEIGNPVTIVQGYLELLDDKNIADDDRKEFVQRGLDELTRIDRLLQHLLDLTRTSEEAPESINVGELLTEVNNVLSIPFSKRGISSSLSCGEEDIFIWGDREQLRQVMLNLLLNSMDALESKEFTSNGAEKSVSVMMSRQRSDGTVVVAVRDNGIGIPESDLGKIFEPFFTSKEPGKGTGLGLAVSYRFIEKLGGRLEVESNVDEGTLFRIILPACQSKSTLNRDGV
jgi:signal transduction histidine kinase